MNVRQLRAHISNLLRGDCSDRLAELERQLNECMNLLMEKESSPPRSDWWDLRVLIEKANQSNYNKINNTETLACLYCALNLKTVGHPDEIALSCRNEPEIYGGLVTHLVDFNLKDFPDDVRMVCSHVFGSCVRSFEFFVKAKTFGTNTAEKSEWTDTALMLTARAKLNSLIIEFEQMRNDLQEMIDTNLPKFRKVLKDSLVTHADSDPEESDEDDDEAWDDQERARPRKRMKTVGEIGTSADTPMQHVSNFGVEISPGKAVKNTRTREFRGIPEPHYANLLGAWATGSDLVISKTLPIPRAPTFSRGAEGKQGITFKLICPGEDVNCDTSVTQKMIDEDVQNNTHLVQSYETMQDLAHQMRNKISEVVMSYNTSFEFVVRVHHDTFFEDFSVNKMTWVQKLAIGRLYLDSISVNKGVDEAEMQAEGEEEEEGGEEDGGSDASFDSDDDSDDDSYEDDDEEEDVDSGDSGDSGESDEEDNSDED